MTHAFFKALLFLGAGSVIIGMHHDQDMRNMGGLRKYMPITWITAIIGSLALAGIPPFAGFFSKDAIIEAVHLSKIPGHGYAYFAVMAGVFITAFYSFRMLFLAFHGTPRFDTHGHEDKSHAAEEPHHEEMHGKPHETPWVVTLPLILLAIPSILIGGLTIGNMVYGDWFGSAIQKSETMEHLAEEFHGAVGMMGHALTTLPFWLAISGVVLAWFLYIRRPDLPAVIKEKLQPLPTILEKKYGFDDFNDWFFAGGARRLGTGLWSWGDKTIIDGIMVNGTAKAIGLFAGVARRMQTGYIYHYAFTMIFGVFALLSFFWLYLQKL